MTPEISIIMPVYNAEGTLKRSLDSIAAQEFKDFELVIVDDCSSDATPNLIAAFAAESSISCNIIRQERNQGVAAARNVGLKAAKGKYLAFVDADDTIAPEALSTAIEAAADGDTDIIGWDWTLGFEKNGRYMRQADYDSPLQALKNLMGGTMRWNLWLFLVKKELLISNGIGFLDGKNMGEDMMFIIKAFLSAKSTVQLHCSLYRYNAISESSLSRQFSEERRAEVEANITEVTKAVESSAYSNELSDYVQHLKLFIKLPLLISSEKSNYKLWFNWYPEANAYATANKALPGRTRFLQWMASHRCWFGVKAWYLLVYKFVYGVIYR